jgi:hypothetical protein
MPTRRAEYVMIESRMLERLRRFATRLYSEQRMNGDEMRDMAHGLLGVVNSAIDVPDDETR